MLSRIGLSSRRDRSSASSPHGYQSTGFSACCARYGLVSFARRFGISRPKEGGLRKEVLGRRPPEGGGRTADGGWRMTTEQETYCERCFWPPSSGLLPPSWNQRPN